jgi:hypothetical protein
MSPINLSTVYQTEGIPLGMEIGGPPTQGLISGPRPEDFTFRLLWSLSE